MNRHCRNCLVGAKIRRVVQSGAHRWWGFHLHAKWRFKYTRTTEISTLRPKAISRVFTKKLTYHISRRVLHVRLSEKVSEDVCDGIHAHGKGGFLGRMLRSE